MGPQEFRVGERLHFYLSTDNPKQIKPRGGTLVEIIGTRMPGAKVYGIVQETAVTESPHLYLIELPAPHQ